MKPSCIEMKCSFFSTDPEVFGCLFSEDDQDTIKTVCPCENGEFEELFGEDGELFNG